MMKWRKIVKTRNGDIMRSQNLKVEPIWNDHQASRFEIIIQNKKFWNLNQDHNMT